MTIALFLSSDGIALAHRQTAGHWAMIGETGLDVPDLSAALAALRAQAVERAGDDFETLLVLPDDQILYTSLTAPTADPELTAYRIEEGLEGLTPYAVTELEYDWQVLEEDRVKLAVVARETLDEARSFATQYDFSCKGFAAMPPMERFPGVPTFGLGAEAAELNFDAEGIAFGPDTFAQPEPEPQSEPEPTPEPVEEAEPEQVAEAEPEAEPETTSVAELEPEAEIETEAEPEPEAEPVVADPEPEPPVSDTPLLDLALDAPIPEPEPAAEPESPTDLEGPAAEETAATDEGPEEAEPQDVNPALAEALQVTAEADAQPEAEAEPEVEAQHSAPPQTIEDPSVSSPVVPIATDPEPSAPTPPAALEEPATPQEVVGDAGDVDDALPPAPSPAALVARQRAQALRGGASAQTPSSLSSAGQISASRGPSAAPDGASRTLSTPDGSGRPVNAPAPVRGALVGQRSSRLGLAHPEESAPTDPTAPADPEAAPEALKPSQSTAAPVASAGNAAAMPRLAEQLQRVRSTGKSRPAATAAVQQTPSRPKVDIPAQAVPGKTGATAPRRPSPFDAAPAPAPKAASKGPSLSGLLGRGKSKIKDAPAADAAAPQDASKPASKGGLLRRRTKPAKPAPEETAVAAPPAETETFASGLLARKTAVQTGGSFKTGLILTVILLLLLALVAIWSAIFLPNSAVARLFGGGEETVEVAGGSGLAAPDVASAAPVIGVAASDPSGADQPSLEDEAAADGVDLSEEAATPLAQDPAADATAEEIAALDAAALPDIDADLDLPPLPVIDQGRNPSLEEAETLYAEDGIWARSPERPDLRPFDLLDRVYTASIDPEVSAFDAVALPDPGVNPGELLRRFPPPPAFGTEYDLTDSGLVAPTPDGVVTPEGAFVILGTPARAPVPRPREIEATAPEINVEDAVLRSFRPAERPVDLAETRERQINRGLTQVELSERRPPVRPASPQEAAAEASLVPDADAGADPDAVDAAVELALQGTDLAVERSLLPRTRPNNIEQIVASADRTPTQAPTAVAASAVAAAPSIPSNADVSRAATERNVIRLRNVNLIGVNGSASDRRALVRLASGRFVRVSVGDRLDGGRVAAIGETTLQYVRSGRTVTLEIPG